MVTVGGERISGYAKPLIAMTVATEERTVGT